MNVREVEVFHPLVDEDKSSIEMVYLDIETEVFDFFYIELGVNQTQ